MHLTVFDWFNFNCIDQVGFIMSRFVKQSNRMLCECKCYLERWESYERKRYAIIFTTTFLMHQKINKHLMTGAKGDSELSFPETEGNIEVERIQNSLFPAGQVIKCFVNIPPNSKLEKKNSEMFCLTPLHTLVALAKLSGCQKKAVLSKNHNNSLFLRLSQLTKNIGST